MSDTNIEWAEKVWNPVSGCTRASAGCDNCYAVKMTHRLEGMGQKKYAGLTVLNGKGDRHFNGVVRTHEDELMKPLRWKKPARIFVNSMSDLFHRDVPFDFIDRVFAVMALCPQHTFMVLTKRAERMAEYLNRRVEDDDGWLVGSGAIDGIGRVLTHWQEGNCDWLNEMNVWSECDGLMLAKHLTDPIKMPLPNVWLGVSTENQQAADERLPHLLKCPAAVRFVSAEPLIGPVELPLIEGYLIFDSGGNVNDQDPPTLLGIDLAIVGGESGPNARPCNVEWIRDIVRQCKAASVACFVKQLGSNPFDPESYVCSFNSFEQWASKASSWLGGISGGGFKYKSREQVVCFDTKGRICRIGRDFMRARDEDAFPVIALRRMELADPKGGDILEFPEDLRIRQFPKGGV